jgi:hypothetical protein
MAISKGKADAGQGGKLGHSNQNHWSYTEEVKEAARKWRRLKAKSEIVEGLEELEMTNEADHQGRENNH